MSDLSFEEESLKVKNLHPDYNNNLEYGEKFVNNYNNTPHKNNFKIIICLLTNNQEKHFIFSYCPSNGNKYATPINPNKIQEEFRAEFMNAFIMYSRLSKNWW